ncbi:MAG TPA: tetratricopeptide repeat protein [Myxococcaceae bacterium]|nr:tetratricopeptide repeat protein [Myxococcaceae bacterium]
MRKAGLLWRGLRSAAVGVAAVALAAGQAWALGPFEKNHPIVERGLEAYRDGRYAEALNAFEAAQKELPPSATLDFNRGNALYKLGRLEEARAAYERALGTDRGELRQKDAFNLGNALAGLSRKKEAAAAYRRALTLDPNDAQARHNLEVVLSDSEPPPPPPPTPDGGSDGGTDGGTPDGGSDAGSSGGGGDGGQADGGAPDGGSSGGNEAPDAGASDGGNRDGGEQPPSPEPASSDGGEGAAVGQLGDEEVKRLLDSMKDNEKNLQMWKFQKKRPRAQNDKDW